MNIAKFLGAPILKNISANGYFCCSVKVIRFSNKTVSYIVKKTKIKICKSTPSKLDKNRFSIQNDVMAI